MKYKYHPCSKEFQEYAKKLGLTGNQLIQKYINEKKLKFLEDDFLKRNRFKDYKEYKYYLAKKKGCKDNREFLERWAKERGYKNYAEYEREKLWNKNIYSPMSENENCPLYLGIHISERKYAKRILPLVLGKIKEETFPNNPWYDFIMIGGNKIQVKSRVLECNRGTNSMYWKYGIDSNKRADYFFLIAFDNRKDLNVMHIWLIKKDEIIRNRKTNQFISLGITFNQKKLSEFQKYDIIDKIDKDLLQEIKLDIQN